MIENTRDEVSLVGEKHALHGEATYHVCIALGFFCLRDRHVLVLEYPHRNELHFQSRFKLLFKLELIITPILFKTH